MTAVTNECSRRDVLKATAASLVVAGCLCKDSGGWGFAQSLLPCLNAQDAHQGEPQKGKIEFASSDEKLVKGFRWAKSQALAYARKDGSIGPWYEASLPGRNAFCMRDVSHRARERSSWGWGHEP